MYNKRQTSLEYYHQELAAAQKTRNELLQIGLSAQLQNDNPKMKLHFMMLSGIDALIEKLYENTIALMSNEKIYLQENCHSATRTLYAPSPTHTCEMKHCNNDDSEMDLIVSNYGLICEVCYQELYDENIID